jgi:hypothetical protein
MRTIKERAEALLGLVEVLVETPGLTWVAASNAIYSPGGPYWHLFQAKADRVAFAKLAESRRIDQLIMGLPEPPVRPAPKEPYDPTRIVEIIDLTRSRKRSKPRRGKTAKSG